MKLKIAFISFFLLLLGCVNYNFYVELQSKYSIVQEEYNRIDSSFVISNYFLCYKNHRYYTVFETNFNTEDSILNMVKLSLQEIGINVVREKGSNFIRSEFCVIGQKLNSQNLQIYIDSLLENTSFFNDNIHYIIPYIYLEEHCQKTNFPTGNVYVYNFGATIMINVIKNKQIVYSKYFGGGWVTDNKTRVTDDWPNCPDPPEVFYEQTHWDTLVGLAMEDYMKRLNIHRR